MLLIFIVPIFEEAIRSCYMYWRNVHKDAKEAGAQRNADLRKRQRSTASGRSTASARRGTMSKVLNFQLGLHEDGLNSLAASGMVRLEQEWHR
jgi:hypothetical protein